MTAHLGIKPTSGINIENTGIICHIEAAVPNQHLGGCSYPESDVMLQTLILFLFLPFENNKKKRASLFRIFNLFRVVESHLKLASSLIILNFLEFQNYGSIKSNTTCLM